MQIVLLGKPGSGKSTVARHLADRFDLTIISSGKIARQLAEIDEITRMQLSHGRKAPEDAIRDLVRDQVEKASVNFVLEGFPRSLAQYIYLSSWTIGPPVFVHLQIDTATAIDRMLDRMREDDNPDAIAARFESFDSDTQPVISMLQAAERLVHIDASQSEAEMVDTLVQMVKGYFL